MERTRTHEPNLTSRQRQVLAMVAKGHTNAEIADALDISLAGAKWHVSELLMKFEVTTREELVDVQRELSSRRRRLVAWGFGLPGLMQAKMAAGFAVAGATVVASGFAVALVMASGDGTETTAPSSQSSSSPTGAPGETAFQFEPAFIGMEVQPDFSLIDARDGTLRSLSEFRGTPVVITTHASWCGPCRAELPMIQEASEELAGQVTIIGINYRETRAEALSLLDEFGVTFPVLLDIDGSVLESRGISGLPNTYLIDAQGVLRGVIVGEIRQASLSRALAPLGIDYPPD